MTHWIVLALAVLTTLVVASNDFVEAAPTGCAAHRVGSYDGYSTCSGGTGCHRVVLSYWNSSQHTYQSARGPWVRPGQRSYSSTRPYYIQSGWAGRSDAAIC